MLCLQPVLCMANPLTWWMMIRDVVSRDKTEDQIRAETPESLHFRWTLWQHAVWDQDTLYELRLQSEHHELPPKEIPPKLRAAGATPEQWSQWLKLLELERRAHLLSSCSSPYARFAYSFFPLGGVQPCLCLLNPCTWMNAHSVHNTREHVESTINADLGRLNCHFRFAATGRSAVFARGLPPASFKSRKSGLVTVVLQGGGLPVPGTARIMQQAEDEELAQSPPKPVRV